MTNNQYRIEFTSDLSRGITVTPIRFALLSNENMAHAFVIKTTRNGQKNDLTGSNVRAYFIPASQNLSVLIDGEVDQNGNAVIELTKDCYYYTGRFFLIIETEMDNVTSCIFYGDGYVTKTNTDEIVAPPEAVGIISAVLYNKPQSLTDAQKAQARANIGAISEVDVPQKGVDYWTPADQESIVQQVIAALGTPVFGRVDADGTVVLSCENLPDGTYTFRFEDENGVVGTCEQTFGEKEPVETMLNLTWTRETTISSSDGTLSASGNDRMSVSNEYTLNPNAVYTLKNLSPYQNQYCSIHAYWYSDSGFVGRTHLTAGLTDNNAPNGWVYTIEPMSGATKVRFRLNYADGKGEESEGYYKFYETV